MTFHCVSQINPYIEIYELKNHVQQIILTSWARSIVSHILFKKGALYSSWMTCFHYGLDNATFYASVYYSRTTKWTSGFKSNTFIYDFLTIICKFININPLFYIRNDITLFVAMIVHQRSFLLFSFSFRSWFIH